jgi:Ca-activated chloride channel homolog
MQFGSLVILTFAAVLCVAQSPASSDMLAAFTISKNVNEVNLVFSVRDSRGHLRSDLTESDFQLLDNQHPPQQIRYFQRQTELPLRVALLIDNSGSITSRIGFEKKAVSVFLKKILRPGVDQALVAAFDDQVRLLQDFTNDKDALEKALRHLQPHGNTALYDAVAFASKKLGHTSDTRVSRRVIILISDGADTASRAMLNDAQRAALSSDAVIFSLSTNDRNWGYPKGEAVLELLSRGTGGNILPAREEGALRRAFAEVEKTLRTQYAVGYTPANFQTDGSFHSVQILPRKSRLAVHCRRGYFAAGKNDGGARL